jgi:hypothetical protein
VDGVGEVAEGGVEGLEVARDDLGCRAQDLARVGAAAVGLGEGYFEGEGELGVG